MKLLIICSAPRSGSSALLKKFNMNNHIGLVPEYDVPSMVKALNVPFQKYKFTSSKAWVNNVDRGAEFNQKTEQFLNYIPHPRSAKIIMQKIYEETFPDKDLEIIGEKYPRFWVLDTDSLLANNSYDTNFLFIFRNPAAVQLSYLHRSDLSRQSLDIWSFNSTYQGIIHWLFAWQLYRHKFLNLKNTLAVKYEDLESEQFNKSINSFLQLNELANLSLEASPKLMEDNLTQHAWWKFLSEITNEWDQRDLSYLITKYDLKYFRRRLWSICLRNPKLFVHVGYLKIGITLYFINTAIRLEKIKHRYKFLSWTFRRVL